LRYFSGVIFSATLAAGVSEVHAHGSSHTSKPAKSAHINAEETDFGRAGDPAKVNRSIRIAGTDDMRYSPSRLTVKVGDTVRFVVSNPGKRYHELVIGTEKDLKSHYEIMKKFPNMEHDEPHMAHVGPGKTREIVWQFTKAGDFRFACLIPGHWESGMAGTIEVAAR
jgi:uncharacterized cupredoxin-like copper-binding protein